MNIWIVNQYAIPSEIGGITRHHNLAKGLMALGHQVTIFAANYDHFSQVPIDTSSAPGELEYFEGVPYVWIPVLPYRGNGAKRIYSMLQFSHRLHKKKYRKALPKPDVIIGSSPQPFAAFSAYRLAKKLGAKFVYEIRDFWPETIINLQKLNRNHPLCKIFFYIERKLFKVSQQVVSLLPGADRYLAKNGIEPSKLTWAPNFINLQSLPDAYPQGDKSEKFMFVFTGAHGLVCGLSCLLDAVKILEEKGYSEKIIVRLIGGGAEKESLIKQAKALQLKSVEFYDAVPKQDIYDFIAVADACLLTIKHHVTLEKWGISPNKLFDYMALAKPIVASVTSANTPVKDAGAGLSVPADSPEELAGAMEQMLLMDPEQLKIMGENGRKYVEANHSLKSVAAKLDQMLQAL